MISQRCIEEELLDDAVMAACREVLMANYEWFKHVSQFENIASIRKTGVEPRSDKGPPDYIKAKFGDPRGAIACLYPVGAELEPEGTKEPPFVRFAIASSDLPIRLGIDWSYDPDLPKIMRQSSPNIAATEIMAAYARRRGSIVSYDVIPPEKLRVCTLDADEDDPGTWPMLVDVNDDAIWPFDY